MPLIKLKTTINAPRAIVFDLARSVDIHLDSTRQTNEKAIAGRTSGLMELGESVTWQATHLGVRQKLTAKITEMDRPNLFVDEMVQGAFHSFRHEHHFEVVGPSKTLMIDVFDYTSPLGFLGRLADLVFLKAYMTRFLEQRNLVLKTISERGTATSK